MKLMFTPFVLAACSLGISGTPFAASIDIDVKGINGISLADVAVSVESVSGTASMRPRATEIEQKNRKFMPLMTVVQTGSEIAFPNNDTVRHHVYSFSPAKPFELKLYSGTPSSPVLFDKPGIVVIGCNIHDRMVAYIQIVNTPYFGKTGETGQVRINDLPAGKYRIRAWHPQMLAGGTIPESEVTVARQDLAITIAMTPGTDGKPH